VIGLWLAAILAVLLSFVADRRRTLPALRRALRGFLGLLPALIGTLAATSLVLAALDPATLESVLAGEGLLPVVIAIGVGSVALIPGFIAYPLAGILRDQGASIPVLAGFLTSLMMVGVLTLPVEAKVLGWRVALLRNLLALVGAAVVSAGMTWVLG